MANKTENSPKKHQHHRANLAQHQLEHSPRTARDQHAAFRRSSKANAFFFAVSLAITIFAAPGQKFAIAQTSQTSAQAPAQNTYAQLPCDLKHGEAHTVVQVKNSTTLILEDGTPVRLSGILAPAPPRSLFTPTQPTPVWPPEKNAVDALTQLTVGQTIVLAFVSPKRDRYNNLQAHVFVKNNGTGPSTPPDTPTKSLIWVQAHLLENGLAQAYEPQGQSHCFEKLLTFEHSARKSNAGIWANPVFGAISSNDITSIEKRNGSYTRVWGKIKSVARRRTLTYLNFGSRWRSDFTITIPRSVIRAHPDWAKSIEALENKSVNVQGWIKIKNGPMIELEHPAQLTVLKQ